MTAIKVLIVEDEELIAEDISSKLKKSGYEVSACVDSCESAVKSFQQDRPDIVFLDIAIAGKIDGIETAKKIKAIADVPVIFLTNLFDEKIVTRAQATRPANYLLKPYSPHQLHISIEQALLNYALKQEAVFGSPSMPVQDPIAIKDEFFLRDSKQEGFEKYHINQILFIKAEGAYSIVYTENKQILLSIPMRRTREHINHPHLRKVHRSYVVNMNAITGVKGNMLKIGQHEIPVSEKYQKEIFSQLQIVR